MNTMKDKGPIENMREFFSRPDVKALQEIQKANHPDSVAHCEATFKLQHLAKAIGAAKWLGVPVENIQKQYAANARELRLLANLARKKGGSYRGKPVEYWERKADEYEKRAAMKIENCWN